MRAYSLALLGILDALLLVFLSPPCLKIPPGLRSRIRAAPRVLCGFLFFFSTAVRPVMSRATCVRVWGFFCLDVGSRLLICRRVCGVDAFCRITLTLLSALLIAHPWLSLYNLVFADEAFT